MNSSSREPSTARRAWCSRRGPSSELFKRWWVPKSMGMLLGFAELSQGNFDIMNWKTFTGAGQKFRVRVQLGTQTKNASLELTEPYFLDQRLALGGRLFFDEYNYYSNVYDQRDYGFDIFMRKPITIFCR